VNNVPRYDPNRISDNSILADKSLMKMTCMMDDFVCFLCFFVSLTNLRCSIGALLPLSSSLYSVTKENMID
jgi:hypothetical protein